EQKVIAITALELGQFTPELLAKGYASTSGTKFEKTTQVVIDGEMRPAVHFNGMTNGVSVHHVVYAFVEDDWRFLVVVITPRKQWVTEKFQEWLEGFLESGIQTPS